MCLYSGVVDISRVGCGGWSALPWVLTQLGFLRDPGQQRTLDNAALGWAMNDPCHKLCLGTSSGFCTGSKRGGRTAVIPLFLLACKNIASRVWCSSPVAKSLCLSCTGSQMDTILCSHSATYYPVHWFWPGKASSQGQSKALGLFTYVGDMKDAPGFKSNQLWPLRLLAEWIIRQKSLISVSPHLCNICLSIKINKSKNKQTNQCGVGKRLQHSPWPVLSV